MTPINAATLYRATAIQRLKTVIEDASRGPAHYANDLALTEAVDAIINAAVERMKEPSDHERAVSEEIRRKVLDAHGEG